MRESRPPDGVRIEVRHAWPHATLWYMKCEKRETPSIAHDRHLIVLNVGGPVQGELRVEDRPWYPNTERRYSFNVSPAGVPLGLRTRDDAERIAIRIVPEFVTSVLAGRGARGVTRRLNAQDPFISNLMLALFELAKAPAPASSLTADCALAALVHAISGLGEPRQLARGVFLRGPELRRVLDYVAANLDKSLSLDELAGVVGMGIHRFVRAFKQSTGTSPHQHVLQMRIGRAKEYLREGALTIGEVASRTGFATQSHFALTFRRMTGATPRRYRDAAR